MSEQFQTGSKTWSRHGGGLMSRGPQLFKQRDVTKVVSAMEKAGVKVCRIEISGGKIVIVAGEPEQAADPGKRVGGEI